MNKDKSFDKLEIPFNLAGITENQFSAFEDVLKIAIKEELQENVSIGFGFNPKENLIGSRFIYILTFEDKPFLKLDASCYFDIDEDVFNKKLFIKDKITIPKRFAEYLASITVGTARGMLYSNTKNTPFNEYFMGLIDVFNMFEGDIEIKL